MLLATLIAAVLVAPLQAHDVKASPFDALRWNADSPEVLVGAEWYTPRAIDGYTLEAIFEFSEARWPGQRAKRFGEDLVEILDGLGWKGDLQVDLDLTLLGTGEQVRLESVAMTHDKRQAIRASTERRPGAGSGVLSKSEVAMDLEAFERGLQLQFAYLGLGGVDLAAALDDLRARLPEPVSAHELARGLDRVITRFGDGHAFVRAAGEDTEPGDRYLPFLLADSQQGVVAFSPDRIVLLEPDTPVVLALDGQPIEEWLAAVEPNVTAGSAQLVRWRSLRDLREFDAIRRARGLQPHVPLRVTFASPDGGQTVDREFELTHRRPIYGDWPTSASRLIDDVGYLRIAQMDDAVEELRAAMALFAQTEGLIVDVRGNGGGSRELLLALAGYLIGEDEPPVVGNVAKYRLAAQFEDDHLEARFMHRAGWEGWTDAQRAAIEACAASFVPEWEPESGPGPGTFSEWHYLVLDRTGAPGEYAYTQPVVILSDAGCFSATDIFLGALELLPRVTLLGTPSSGGSARSQAFRLPASGIEVRCASMASFRPDGRLYDGRGIEVDLLVPPEPDSLLVGGEDNQLAAALDFLTGD